MTIPVLRGFVASMGDYARSHTSLSTFKNIFHRACNNEHIFVKSYQRMYNFLSVTTLTALSIVRPVVCAIVYHLHLLFGRPTG